MGPRTPSTSRHHDRRWPPLLLRLRARWDASTHSPSPDQYSSCHVNGSYPITSRNGDGPAVDDGNEFTPSGSGQDYISVSTFPRVNVITIDPGGLTLPEVAHRPIQSPSTTSILKTRPPLCFTGDEMGWNGPPIYPQCNCLSTVSGRHPSGSAGRANVSFCFCIRVQPASDLLGGGLLR